MIDALNFMAEMEQECSDFKKDLSALDLEEQIDILKLSCSQIYPEEEIRDKMERAMKSKESLKIQIGIDPLSMELQIARIPPLVLGSKLQRMGHSITILIGDFSALIEDPSDIYKNKMNLNRKVIAKNFKRVRKHLESFLDFTKANTVYNSAWLKDLKFQDFIELIKEIKVSDSIEVCNFGSNADNGKNLSYAELVYPIIMGIDSLEISPDIEIAKHDQFYNLKMSRYIMGIKGQEPESIMVTAALPHQDDCFSINEKPINIFKYISTLNKEDVIQWFKLLTEITPETLENLKERLNKRLLDLESTKEILSKIIINRLYDETTSRESYIKYIKERVKKTETEEIRMISGSTMSIGEFIAASTELTLSEVQEVIDSGGARALSCDGECLTYIIDGGAEIGSINFDKFYILMSDKQVLRIIK